MKAMTELIEYCVRRDLLTSLQMRKLVADGWKVHPISGWKAVISYDPIEDALRVAIEGTDEKYRYLFCKYLDRSQFSSAYLIRAFHYEVMDWLYIIYGLKYRTDVYRIIADNLTNIVWVWLHKRQVAKQLADLLKTRQHEMQAKMPVAMHTTPLDRYAYDDWKVTERLSRMLVFNDIIPALNVGA